MQYRERLILNITLFVESFWGREHREDVILNVTLLIVSVWACNIG